MSFFDKMQDYLSQGVGASRDFIAKASERAKDLTEKGVLKLEIMQLQGNAEKLFAKLGNEVYKLYTDESMESVPSSTPSVRSLIAQIDEVRDQIDKKEAALRVEDGGME
jgi:hypothetical protein